MSKETAPRPALNRILGLGFSVALAFGGTVGTGILRLPGTVAEALGDPTLVILVWIAGGVYALLGAVSVSELAAMMPTAGGFYVYARRIFGPGFGFLVGWNDWILNCLSLATATVAAADFTASLFPSQGEHPQVLAVCIIGTLTTLHWFGVRIGSGLQNAISATVGLLLVGLAIACFALPAAVNASDVASAGPTASLPLLSFGMVAAFAVALRSVIFTYDGWYAAIYLAEETVDAPRVLPRAMIGTAVLLTCLFVLVNAGFLHALPLPVLAASKLPAADVAHALFPHGGFVFVTVVSLLTVLGLSNAILLSGPRILYALSRDGLLSSGAATVSAGGTPRVALGITGLAVALLILTGTLHQLVAVTAVVFVLSYLSAYVGVFVLRVREPDAPRPFRAWGFPLTTGLALAGSLAFLIAGIIEDPRSGQFAAILLAIAAPFCWWASRRRK